MKQENQREFYRVRYPELERPRFWVGRHCLEVLDCSERGVRFRCSDGSPIPLGAGIRGRLRFASGRDLVVSGTIVRVEGVEAAVHLEDPGIPFRLILQEQIYLRKRAVDSELLPLQHAPRRS